MEALLKSWTLFAALAWLLLVYLGSGLYVCRKYTGTWNGLKFSDAASCCVGFKE